MLEKGIKNFKMRLKNSQQYALFKKTLKYGLNIHILGILSAFMLYKLHLYNAFDVKNNIFYKSFYSLSPFLFYACMILSYLALWIALFLFLKKISNHVNYNIEKDKIFMQENEERNKNIEVMDEILTAREIRQKLKEEREKAKKEKEAQEAQNQENSTQTEEKANVQESKEAPNENSSA